MINKFSKNLFSYKHGNTLSETLIVMVILGVIFTVAMGTVVADYKKNETVVRMKRIHSILSQAFYNAISREGSSRNWDVAENLSEKGSYGFFDKYLKNSLVLSLDCQNSTKGECDYNFKELDGTEKSLNSTWNRFFLNDGTFIAMQTIGKDKYKVVYFYVDTNGKKRLNVVARDIFLFEYWVKNDAHSDYEGKLLAHGHEYTREQLISESNPNNCNKTKNGNYCSALIMKDNWRIIPGYPWAQARYVVQ